MPENRDELRTWRKLGLDSCWKEKTYKNTITHKTFVKGTNGKRVDRSKTNKETVEKKVVQFDRKKFNKIVTGLVQDRLEEIYNQTRKNQEVDMQIEDKLAQAINDVNEKYNISGAIRQFSLDANESADFDLSPAQLFAEKTEKQLNKMFYRNMPAREACELARTRIERAKFKYDCVADESGYSKKAIQREQAEHIRGAISAYSDLEKIHNTRSTFFKLFHYPTFSGEKHNLDFFKRSIMQNFNINEKQFDATLKDINSTSISSTMADQLKVTGIIKESVRNNPNRAREYAEQKIDRSNKKYNKAELFTTASEDAKAIESRANEEIKEINNLMARVDLTDDLDEDDLEEDGVNVDKAQQDNDVSIDDEEKEQLPPIEDANPVDKNAAKSNPPQQDPPQTKLVQKK